MTGSAPRKVTATPAAAASRIADTALMLRALQFSAERHRDQRRKDRSASPYINHLIGVANVLANVGGITDTAVLVGAILHDTLEDTKTSGADIEASFGREIRRLVEEVTDDASLPRADRKRLQVEHAPRLSDRAKLIKIADKICNILDVTHTPPTNWSLERRKEYLDWTERVVAGCRGCNERLERQYDAMLRRARLVVAAG
ncbi:MAG TPA: HD domain-containing protein [Candidatus Methylomirabilis sp.]|nr:HD domain-containing protein [Candidatus Methylomirabilis sp.]